jgi:hypothetical protein
LDGKQTNEYVLTLGAADPNGSGSAIVPAGWEQVFPDGNVGSITSRSQNTCANALEKHANSQVKEDTQQQKTSKSGDNLHETKNDFT